MVFQQDLRVHWDLGKFDCSYTPVRNDQILSFDFVMTRQ